MHHFINTKHLITHCKFQHSGSLPPETRCDGAFRRSLRQHLWAAPSVLVLCRRTGSTFGRHALCLSCVAELGGPSGSSFSVCLASTRRLDYVMFKCSPQQTCHLATVRLTDHLVSTFGRLPLCLSCVAMLGAPSRGILSACPASPGWKHLREAPSLLALRRKAGGNFGKLSLSLFVLRRGGGLTT